MEKEILLELEKINEKLQEVIKLLQPKIIKYDLKIDKNCNFDELFKEDQNKRGNVIDTINLKEQLDQLEELSIPLVEYLKKSNIEYSKIIITKESVELVATDKFIPIE